MFTPSGTLSRCTKTQFFHPDETQLADSFATSSSKTRGNICSQPCTRTRHSPPTHRRTHNRRKTTLTAHLRTFASVRALEPDRGRLTDRPTDRMCTLCCVWCYFWFYYTVLCLAVYRSTGPVSVCAVGGGDTGRGTLHAEDIAAGVVVVVAAGC